jgi:hypothetical protein
MRGIRRDRVLLGVTPVRKAPLRSTDIRALVAPDVDDEAVVGPVNVLDVERGELAVSVNSVRNNGPLLIVEATGDQLVR